MRPFRRYRGVAIWRSKDLICGSDLDFNSDGLLVEKNGKYSVYYHWTDGYLCDTIQEVKDDIDGALSAAESRDIPLAEMVKTLNEYSS